MKELCVTVGPDGEQGTCIARPARHGDAGAIAHIYNQAILARTSTFETDPRTAEQIQALLVERGDLHPTVVVERGRRIVGWAASSAHSTRVCFAGIAECSVYVERAERGRGVGRAAVAALIRECERRRFWKLIARIFPENAASLALARSLGFRDVGVFLRHGQVDGVWRDAVILERLLNSERRDLPCSSALLPASSSSSS